MVHHEVQGIDTEAHRLQLRQRIIEDMRERETIYSRSSQPLGHGSLLASA
jgi:hypothetical protein